MQGAVAAAGAVLCAACWQAVAVALAGAVTGERRQRAAASARRRLLARQLQPSLWLMLKGLLSLDASLSAPRRLPCWEAWWRGGLAAVAQREQAAPGQLRLALPLSGCLVSNRCEVQLENASHMRLSLGAPWGAIAFETSRSRAGGRKRRGLGPSFACPSLSNLRRTNMQQAPDSPAPSVSILDTNQQLQSVHSAWPELLPPVLRHR